MFYDRLGYIGKRLALYGYDTAGIGPAGLNIKKHIICLEGGRGYVLNISGEKLPLFVNSRRQLVCL